MKKKALILFSLFACVSAFTTSCGGGDNNDDNTPQGEITLRFWNGFTGADGDSMKEIVNAFNSEYSGKIKIEVDTVNWDSLFLKLIQNKGKEKFSPHIVAMGSNRLGQMVDKGIIRSINDITETIGAKEEDYLDTAWNAGLFGEDRYGFPLDMHPTAMFYNKDLISEDEIPTTWEEFEAICKEKTKDGVYGWAIPNLYSITKDIFLSMLLQDGSDMLDDSNKAIFNNETAVKWLTKLQDWKYVDKISPESVGNSGDLTLFNTGKSVFYFDGPWQINTLKDISTVDFGVAPMPGSTGTNGTSYTGSHQFTLVECTTEDKAIREACYTFINYVNQNPMSWAEAGQVTAYKPVHETDEYKAISELAPFTEEAELAQIGNVSYEYYYDCYNYVGSAVAACLNDSQSNPKAVLDDYVNRFNKFLQEQ